MTCQTLFMDIDMTPMNECYFCKVNCYLDISSRMVLHSGQS